MVNRGSIFSAVSDNFFVKIQQLSPKQQGWYCRLLFQIIAQGLVSASQHDAVIRRELLGYPVGFRLKMQILPNHAQFVLKVTDSHTWALCDDDVADLTINIKHLSVAMLLLTFQESTAQAFANDRMTVDGDIGFAVRFVRILNQLEALILPKMLAKYAIKRYPILPLSQKLRTAGAIYVDIAKSWF